MLAWMEGYAFCIGHRAQLTAQGALDYVTVLQCGWVMGWVMSRTGVAHNGCVSLSQVGSGARQCITEWQGGGWYCQPGRFNTLLHS